MENKIILEHYRTILDGCKFTYIDIGSRGGLSSEWERVKEIIDIVLFEPDEQEAKILQESASKNTLVIPKAVWDHKGVVKFKCTRNSSYGSVLEPDINVLEGTYYYCRNFYEVDEVLDVEVDILEEILKENNVNQIDFLKIDIQGAENYIFNSINNWKDITGVHTEAYAAKLYTDGADISTTLSQLYKQELQLYDIKIIAEAPIVEVDNLNIFSKELLNARPKSGYKSRPMVYDLLLFKDKIDVLSKHDKVYIRKMIFVLCVYEYFDYALYLAIKSFNKKIFDRIEKELIIRSVTDLHAGSLSKFQNLKESIKSPSFSLSKR